MKKWLLVGLLSHCISTVYAFGLEEAWEAAERHSAEYQAAVYNHDAEREKEQQAKAAFYPVLSADSDYQRQSSDWSEARSQYGWRIQLSQSLYDAEKTARYRQSRLNTQTVQESLEADRDDLKLQVSQSYFDALLAEDSVQAARTEKEAYRRQIVQAQKLFEHGMATAVDMHEAQAGYDQALAKEIDALARKQIAQNQLHAYTGLEAQNIRAVESNQLIGRFQQHIETRSLDDWQRAALEHNPEYRTRQAALKGAWEGVGLAKAARQPKLQLQAAYQQRRQHPYQGHAHSAKGWTLNLQLSLPLYDGGADRSHIREASARAHEAQSRLLATELSIKLAVTQAYTESNAARYQVLAQERVLNSSRLKLKATETGKQYGIRNTLEVVRARQEVSDAEQKLAQARYRYMMAFLSLIKASGMDMTAAWRAVNHEQKTTTASIPKAHSTRHRFKPKKRYWLHQVRMIAA